jgi:hypothetical protein
MAKMCPTRPNGRGNQHNGLIFAPT